MSAPVVKSLFVDETAENSPILDKFYASEKTRARKYLNVVKWFLTL